MILTETLEPWMLDKAKLWHDQIEETGLFKTKNYTKLYVKRRFEIGYHGELCVAAALNRHGLEIEHRVNTSGKRQDPEIVIHLSRGRSITVEVKCAGSPHYQNAMFPEIQTIDADFLCAPRRDLAKRKVEIFGFEWGCKANLWPVDTFGDNDVPTRFCPLIDLMPPDEFVELIKCFELVGDGGKSDG